MVIEAAVGLAGVAAAGFGTLWMRDRLRLLRNVRLLADKERGRIEAVGRAEQAERKTSRLHEVLDALPVAVWRRDATGASVAHNRTCVAAFGENAGPEFARDGAVIAATRRGGEIGDPHSGETHIVIGGERRLLRPVEIACADGGRIGYAIDCTETESAQDELRRHIAAHAAVLESLAAAVAIFGPDKHLKFANTAFARLWDLEEGWLGSEPMIGEILERLHASRRFPEYPDFRAFKRERCALFTSLIEPRQELMYLPDGRTLQLTISPHPFGGLTYVYDDVSDRLALERSYNTLAQVQRATLDNLFEAIAVYGGDGRLKLYNPAFCSLWGLSPADVAGEPHISEISDKVRPLLDDGNDWEHLREELIAQVTCQMFTSAPLYRRDGSVLQIASVPLPDGEVLLTYLDVSDTARVERALRERNQALETAARLKTEFIANVSHEMRTPLNSIIGFTEILDKQYFGTLNPSQSEYSRLILDSSHQLLALINDMIDLATIEAGDLELQRGAVDVRDLLHSVAALARERARSRALEIEVSCAAGIGLIEADERRLKQALFNLVSNAVKFTPPGGVIRMRAQRSRNELLLSVCEWTGGIPPNRSSQARDSARHRNLTAAGFGLSLVKSLVELHGGRLEIDVAPGSGTRITCRLPAGGADHEDQVTATSRQGERIDSSQEVAAA
jgi:signal transduction histidine kinase